MANTLGDWARRYWLWLLLIAFAIGGFAARWLLPSSPKAEKIQFRFQLAQDQHRHEHTVLEAEMNARIQELIRIQSISDLDERRRRLVEFSNRRRARDT